MVGLADLIANPLGNMFGGSVGRQLVDAETALKSALGTKRVSID